MAALLSMTDDPAAVVALGDLGPRAALADLTSSSLRLTDTTSSLILGDTP